VNEKANEKEGISVETFFFENEKKLELKLISSKKGFHKQVTEKEIHRPGLALGGFVELFTYERIQVFGNTEIAYLRKLTPIQREKTLKKLFSFDIPLSIVTNNNRLPSPFVQMADEYGISVFRTPLTTIKFIQLLEDYLDEKFTPSAFIHGSLVDVYGIGVLITGRSGIGKSEVALDLVARGHRLVTDDVVTVRYQTGGILIGTGNKTLRYNMEIRGVGIIDIQAVFGIRAIRKQKRVEVRVELVDWDDKEKYERLGLEEIVTEILGEKIPLVQLPIYPGKNISVIVEVIALNELLKIYGHHSAREFEERLDRRMKAKLPGMEEYLGKDYE